MTKRDDGDGIESTTRDRAQRVRRRPRAALLLAGVAGLGCAVAAGCGGTSLEGGPNGGTASDAEIGQSAEAVVSSPSCVSLRRPGTSPTVVFDTQIVSPGAPATQNFGIAPTLAAGTFGGKQRQALIQFDLSSIPSGPNTNITSASLFLAQGGVTPINSGAETLNVHRVTSLWHESTVTWQSFAGGFDATVWATFTNASQFPSAILNTLVQGWVRGTYPNHGLLLESATNVTSFRSSEYGSVGFRPGLNVCFTVTCNPGFADCNHSALDGCEANLATATSCGSCGNSCGEMPNATAACVSSACAVGSCNAGFADCNHSPTDGCETALTTNANCGGCGVVCAIPGATASCATGTCTLISCNAGHYDCDGNPSNGCEATPCATGSHCGSAADCTSGVCTGGVCQAGSSGGLYHGWASPIAGCLTNSYDSTDGTVDGGSYPYNAGDSLGCKAWKLAATICNTQPTPYADQNNWSCPSSGGFTDPIFGTFCASQGTQYSCSGCPGACNAACVYHPLSLRNCQGQEVNQPPPAPIVNGGACSSNAACASGLCQAGTCRPPSCNNGVQDSGETGVDCGGGCNGCPGGQACNVSTDCANQQCHAGVCGAVNGGACSVNADCGSTLCQGALCRPPSCNDGLQNNGETGVDCGGGACLGCQGGQVCVSGSDCLSGTCAANNLCTTALYHGWTSPIAGCLTNSYDSTDGTVDGGSYPYNAGDSLGCKAWKLAATICNTQPTPYADQNNWSCPSSGGFTDPIFGTFCASQGTQYSCSGCPGACNAACVYHPLSLRNCQGQEVNQPPPAPIVNGGACSSNAACASGLCQAGTCRPPSCNNGVLDGGETGVDCGGNCNGCPGGQACNVNTDCANQQCHAGVCGAVNGGACSVNADCGSTLCQGALCRPPSCNDGVQNGGETGVDCGGGACLGCAGGQACATGADCFSGTCAANNLCTVALYHGWTSPIAGCSTTAYDSTAPTADGGTYPFNAADTAGCKAWKLAATICNTQPTPYSDQNNWSCPSSGGFTDPLFGTFCLSQGTQYSCSGCPGACNAACIYHPLSLRNCQGQETNEQ